MGAQYQQLLDLAMDRAIDGKGGLAASIAETCLDPNSNLGEKELSLAFDIVRILIDKVELDIRRNIAEYLAERDDVPPDLIRFLANDEIVVAYPVLVHSGMLRDDELIDIAVKKSARHRLAVAIRMDLSEPVTEALVRSKDPDVIATLLYNDNATIRPKTLDALVNASRSVKAYREPLTHRSDLTDDQARRMYAWVGEALRNHIVGHFDIEPELAEEATTSAVTQALGDQGLAPEPSSASKTTLIDAIRSGKKQEFETRFAELIGLSAAATKNILFGPNPQTLAVACKAGDLSVVVFGELMSRIHGGKDQRAFQKSEKFTSAVAYFNELDIANAKETIEIWRESKVTD